VAKRTQVAAVEIGLRDVPEPGPLLLLGRIRRGLGVGDEETLPGLMISFGSVTRVLATRGHGRLAEQMRR
jgi:hypothetical protein